MVSVLTKICITTMIQLCSSLIIAHWSFVSLVYLHLIEYPIYLSPTNKLLERKTSEMARSDSTREMGYSEPSNRREMERDIRRQRMRSVSRGVSRMMIPNNRPIRQFDDTVNNKVIFLKWNPRCHLGLFFKQN